MTIPLKNLKIDWKHVCEKPSVANHEIGDIHTCEICRNHWKVIKAPWSTSENSKVWQRVALSDQDYY